MLKINYDVNLIEIRPYYNPSLLTFTYIFFFRPIDTRRDSRVKVTVCADSSPSTKERQLLHSKTISFRSCNVLLLTQADMKVADGEIATII